MSAAKNTRAVKKTTKIEETKTVTPAVTQFVSSGDRSKTTDSESMKTAKTIKTHIGLNGTKHGRVLMTGGHPGYCLVDSPKPPTTTTELSHLQLKGHTDLSEAGLGSALKKNSDLVGASTLHTGFTSSDWSATGEHVPRSVLAHHIIHTSAAIVMASSVNPDLLNAIRATSDATLDMEAGVGEFFSRKYAPSSPDDVEKLVYDTINSTHFMPALPSVLGRALPGGLASKMSLISSVSAHIGDTADVYEGIRGNDSFDTKSSDHINYDHRHASKHSAEVIAGDITHSSLLIGSMVSSTALFNAAVAKFLGLNEGPVTESLGAFPGTAAEDAAVTKILDSLNEAEREYFTQYINIVFTVTGELDEVLAELTNYSSDTESATDRQIQLATIAKAIIAPAIVNVTTADKEFVSIMDTISLLVNATGGQKSTGGRATKQVTDYYKTVAHIPSATDSNKLTIPSTEYRYTACSEFVVAAALNLTHLHLAGRDYNVADTKKCVTGICLSRLAPWIVNTTVAAAMCGDKRTSSAATIAASAVVGRTCHNKPHPLKGGVKTDFKTKPTLYAGLLAGSVRFGEVLQFVAGSMVFASSSPGGAFSTKLADGTSPSKRFSAPGSWCHMLPTSIAFDGDASYMDILTNSIASGPVSDIRRHAAAFMFIVNFASVSTHTFEDMFAIGDMFSISRYATRGDSFKTMAVAMIDTMTGRFAEDAAASEYQMTIGHDELSSCLEAFDTSDVNRHAATTLFDELHALASGSASTNPDKIRAGKKPVAPKKIPAVKAAKIEGLAADIRVRRTATPVQDSEVAAALPTPADVLATVPDEQSESEEEATTLPTSDTSVHAESSDNETTPPTKTDDSAAAESEEEEEEEVVVTPVAPVTSKRRRRGGAASSGLSLV